MVQQKARQESLFHGFWNLQKDFFLQLVGKLHLIDYKAKKNESHTQNG